MVLKPEYEGSMTPDEVLVALRDYTNRLLDEVDRANKTGVADFSSPEEAYTMAELFELLDEWITGNNPPPSDWRSLSRARLEVVEAELQQIQKEQELEQAQKHTYRPYDTSGQERA